MERFPLGEGLDGRRYDRPSRRLPAIAVKWFKMQLDKTIAEVDDSFSKYRLSEAMMAVYKLFWDEFSLMVSGDGKTGVSAAD